MIHALLIVTQDGMGHVAYDDGLGINFTLFSGMLMALNKFLSQIFGGEQIHREIELELYSLLLKETGKGLWVCIHDASDNRELTYQKLDQLISLLEEEIDFEKDLKGTLDLDAKLKKKIEKIIKIKTVPRALQSYISKEINWLSEGRMINIILQNVYLISLEGGIASSWEKEAKPDFSTRYACLKILKSLPNTVNLKLELSIKHEAGTDEWRFRRIGNSEFFLFLRAIMNEGSRALFEILIDRIIDGLVDVLKMKASIEPIVEPSAILPPQKPLVALKQKKQATPKREKKIPKDEELLTSLETLVQKVAKRIKTLSAIEVSGEDNQPTRRDEAED